MKRSSPVREIECPTCEAEFETPPTQTGGNCPKCGRCFTIDEGLKFSGGPEEPEFEVFWGDDTLRRKPDGL